MQDVLRKKAEVIGIVQCLPYSMCEHVRASFGISIIKSVLLFV